MTQRLIFTSIGNGSNDGDEMKEINKLLSMDKSKEYWKVISVTPAHPNNQVVSSGSAYVLLEEFPELRHGTKS